MTTKTTITDLFELANQYPSPHNGQPIEVVQIDDEHFDIYFRKERGLHAAEVSYLFSYVTMGVFMYHLSLCAKALGFSYSYTTSLPSRESLKGEGTVKFATCVLKATAQKQDTELLKTIKRRQTSRKKYYEGVSGELSNQMIDIAEQMHLELYRMNKQDTHQAIWLNQRAVFDDMFDDAVRSELNHWLRYSEKEKEEKMDGLAYDCMEINGRVMRFIVKHYKVLRMPGISQLLKRYYLRTMSDNSDAYYLLTPFSTENEGFEVGVAVMKIWEVVASKGYYLHPFGTIMSNQAAHADFLKLAHIEHEDIHKNFLVFIYRCGKSEVPHESLRLPVKDHLLRTNHV